MRIGEIVQVNFVIIKTVNGYYLGDEYNNDTDDKDDGLSYTKGSFIHKKYDSSVELLNHVKLNLLKFMGDNNAN